MCACVYFTSKNPKDEPNSGRAQRALALAYDGDADMWLFCHWDNVQLQLMQLRDFLRQNKVIPAARSMLFQTKPCASTCIVCAFVVWFLQNKCTVSSKQLENYHWGKMKYWKWIKWIHFWQNRLPLCTMLVQYQVSQCFLSFWCLYCLYYTTYMLVLFFLWCWLITLLEADYHWIFYHWIQTLDWHFVRLNSITHIFSHEDQQQLYCIL